MGELDIKKLVKKPTYRIDPNSLDFDTSNGLNVNVEILRLLSEGFEIRDIPIQLQLLHIEPNSLSIVEKKINAMRRKWRCDTIFQLMYELGSRKIFEFQTIE